ncbi:hypothetical protein AB5J49_41615 [Streptomyces sp. R28]|uniref:Uncharacterized protein n=1 Tax=Streptomyces sp. R28 TaxID=3238628 RepID=A0AB39QA05_9ACTN
MASTRRLRRVRAFAESTLEDRITAALTDWRGELDSRFGEMNSPHTHANPSLTVEDRCLLPRRPIIWRLSILIRLTCPSATHESQASDDGVAVAVDARGEG